MTRRYLLKLLPLKPCKVSAARTVVNTLRTGQELLALNVQSGKRKKSKLVAGKTFLGLRNTSSQCPGPAISSGQQGKVELGNPPPSSPSESGNAFPSSWGHLPPCPWRTFCTAYILTCPATGGSRAASPAPGCPSCEISPVPGLRTAASPPSADR